MAFAVIATVPINIFLTYLVTILRGLELFRRRSAFAILNQVAALFCVFAFVFCYQRSAEIGVLANLIAALISAGLAVYLLHDFLLGAWKARAVRSNDVGSALSLGFRGQLGNLASFFNYRLDVFVVNYFLGPAQVGIYAVGVVVSEALWQVPQAAAVAIGPRTVRTIDKGASEFTCFVLHQVLVVAFVSCAAVALVSPLAMHFLFGDRFRASVSVIWWLLPGVIALSLAKVAASDLMARGKPEFSSMFAFVALVVTLVLDFTLIPRMGINGAALASSVAYVVNAGLLAAALKREMSVTWKVFLVPARSEFQAYRLAWQNFRAWLWRKAISSGPVGSAWPSFRGRMQCK